MLSDLRIRLRTLFRQKAVETELDEELRFHLEQQTEKYIQSGMTPEEAARRARIELGGIEQAKEEHRDARGIRFLEDTWRDIAYATRMLRKSPGFTIVAVLTLALGIGANTATFSVAEAALFPQFPASNPGRLAGIYASGPDGSGYASTSYPDYLYYRDHDRAFSGLLAYAHIRLAWTHKDRTDFPWAAIVTSNYFAVLGVKPFLGSTFGPGEDSVAHGPAVAVVSYSFWKQQLAMDPNVLGKSLILNGHAFTVVGVLPREFKGVDLAWGGLPAIWVPMSAQAVAIPTGKNQSLLRTREARFLLVMGRLEPGVSLEQAGTETKVAAAQLAQAYPVSNAGRTAFVLNANQSRIWPGWRDSVLRVLLLMGVASGLLLLVACATMANLLLTRAAARQNEMAVRFAMGCSRGKAILQLLAESVLLALIGAAAGLLFARFLIGIAETFQLTPYMHMNMTLRLDDRVLFFTLLLTLVTALIFGLVPAFTASRVNLSEALKETANRSSEGPRARDLRSWTVAVEMTFAFLSLVGCGLFAQSVIHLKNTSLGFNPNHVLVATTLLSPSQYSSAQGSRLYERLLRRVSSLPGVRSASLSWMGPLTTLRSIEHVIPEGTEGQDPSAGIEVQKDVVSPGYFKTLRVPLLRGRDFATKDDAQAPPVAIVNRTFAEAVWPHQNPLGRRFKLRGGSRDIQVIGVVANMKYHTVWETPEPFMYLPLAQTYSPQVTLLVRTSANPISFLPEVRQSVKGLGRPVPIYDVNTLQEQVAHALAQPRLMATLTTVFGAIALLLAVVGIYGVVSFSVTQRTREVGIRMALGARRADLWRLFAGQGVAMAALGIGAGIVAALGASRLLASALYGVKPTDPFTFVAASLILAGSSLFASYIPAWRAMRIDPAEALRHE